MQTSEALQSTEEPRGKKVHAALKARLGDDIYTSWFKTLDFDGFESSMERATGLEILNLAAPGAGPLYNRFVLDAFLREHRARNVLYVVDSFAFYSRAWNEERFADAKLLRGTPLRAATARHLWAYVRHEGVDARALLDYLSGFSKINNRERFEPDVWEGEAQFDRVYRPSVTAVKKRIAYLFPDGTSPSPRDRYLGVLSSLVERARRDGAGVVVIEMPVPPAFERELPDEAAFDQALRDVLGALQVPFHDFSGAMSDPRSYFDSDHLNRTGLTQFFSRDLRPVLVPAGGVSGVAPPAAEPAAASPAAGR